NKRAAGEGRAPFEQGVSVFVLGLPARRTKNAALSRPGEDQMQALCGAAALALVLLAGAATAQTSYPDKQVRLLVGFAAGGPADIAARIVADGLSEAWGKPFVVENVTGAAGNV